MIRKLHVDLSCLRVRIFIAANIRSLETNRSFCPRAPLQVNPAMNRIYSREELLLNMLMSLSQRWEIHLGTIVGINK